MTTTRAFHLGETFGDGSRGGAKDAVDRWLAEQVAIYGETREVRPLSDDEHTRIDPFTEMRTIKPDAEIITVAVPDE